MMLRAAASLSWQWRSCPIRYIPTMAFETLKASKVFRRVAEPRVENMLFVVEDFYCA